MNRRWIEYVEERGEEKDHEVFEVVHFSLDGFIEVNGIVDLLYFLVLGFKEIKVGVDGVLSSKEFTDVESN